MNAYLSIPEFAKLAGVSHQAIYKGLRNRLQPYLQPGCADKMLSVQALKDIYCIEVAQPHATNLQPNLQPGATPDSMTETLREQLAEKDRQIRIKDEQIKSLHRIIEQQNALALADKRPLIRLATENSAPSSQPRPVPPPSPARQGQPKARRQPTRPDFLSAKRWYEFWK